MFRKRTAEEKTKKGGVVERLHNKIMETVTMYKEITMDEFLEMICSALKDFYGNENRVRRANVRKNNGIILHGVTLINENSNISPTVYVDDFYEEYNKGCLTLGEIVNSIIKVGEEHAKEGDFSMDFFTDFEKVKSRLVFKLVNTEKNRELLKDIPSFPYMDMSYIFYCILDSEMLGEASILVYNNHLKLWNIEKEELLALARKNTPLHLPAKISSMEDVMRSIIKEDLLHKCDEYMETYLSEEELSHDDELRMKEPEQWLEVMADRLLDRIIDMRDSFPMYVVTNQKKLYGAACMTYDGLLENFGKRLQKNFYILPSSVHEIILVPDENLEDAQRLQSMVREVNETQVSGEEVLTDSVYYYDWQEDIISRL